MSVILSNSICGVVHGQAKWRYSLKLQTNKCSLVLLVLIGYVTNTSSSVLDTLPKLDTK
jgi:hypothetical protein